ncbi:arginase family protein [Microbacterium sp. cx-55]|uniref:arginase family protein n=1 Tax=Microbacterium sp. cx-55 TaxID=2875948 RepID=UPI001CBD68B6|nr:arginase family protein [Microbacterium sp. cx-55]MBZ4488682.1 arginase family protein [Microbacterium sp. cx-55]UGB36076.1 arginase family protein [Microbacterium sp. cx-55]
MTRFLIVPQWQGSPSARAMNLIDGADAIAGDLPRSACERIPVPLEAGDELGTGVHRYSALRQVRLALDAAFAPLTERALTIGGDCSVAVAGVGRSAADHGRVAVVWADAHPDLHSPETSTSHAFGGMALRAVLGDGAPELTLPSGTVRPSDVILVGARALDDAEVDYIAAHGIRIIDSEALRDPAALATAVAELGVDAVHVHVDVDVLDPAEMPGVKASEPFGAALADLIAAIKELRAATPLAGASLAGFAPASAASAPDDMGTLLRLIGALA